jgi:hypothetical protein
MDLDEVLRRVACFANAPLPLDPFAPDVQAFRAASTGKSGITVAEHELWSASIELAPSLRAELKPSSGDEKSAAEALARFFVGYFVWPPPEMRFNADALEPHLVIAAELARRLGLDEVLGYLQHQRALFRSWGGVNFPEVLPLEEEALTAYRRSNNGTPHPGQLILILTALAYFEEGTGHVEPARQHLEEAEAVVTQASTEPNLQTYVIHCQMAQLCRRAGDAAAQAAAEARARRVLGRLDHADRLEHHLSETMPLALWQLQRFIGF